MKVGIMQPYFFPYIGYWQLINAVDKYVIYDDVNYIKGGWINRNKILLNGVEKMINLRLHDASSNRMINDTEVLVDRVYNKKLLKTLEFAYKDAPNFSESFEVIEKIINQDEKNLARYLTFLIQTICNSLSIKTELVVSSTIEKDIALRGQDKVLNICKSLGVDEYINAIGGTALYSAEDFIKQGISLNFLKTNKVSYNQFNNAFAENLSIIDVMMFNSAERVKQMLNKYELI